MRGDPGSEASTPRQTHSHAYQEMLGVLGTGQRDILAALVGQLAVMRSPNFEEAASKIATTLSDKQAEAILAIRDRLDRYLSESYEAHKRRILKHQSPEVQHVFADFVSSAEEVGDDPGLILLAFAVGELLEAVTHATERAPTK